VRFDASHEKVAGFLDFKELAIYVNAADPYNRKTFTIAHELGHYVLHAQYFREHPEAYRVLLRRPMSAASDPREKEANAFAGHLLVPRHFLEGFYKLATVHELADLFAVSADVIRIRLQQEFPSHT
jgi:Zn-dependent peptidase ImmA (M78 family)